MFHLKPSCDVASVIIIIIIIKIVADGKLNTPVLVGKF